MFVLLVMFVHVSGDVDHSVVLQLPSLELQDEAEIMHYIFMLIPTYT